MKAKELPLLGLKVLDLTHRLPGPLAGHLLSTQGAEVIKVEDETFGDPFKDGLFKEMDPSFSLWYKSLNEHKEVQRFPLTAERDRLLTLIKETDIILMGLPPKVQAKLGVTFEDLKKVKSQPFVVITMTGSHHEKDKGMHDLNALAKEKLLHLLIGQNLEDKKALPPFLPVAGISFGSYLVIQALSAYTLALRTNSPQNFCVSLQEAVQMILKPFYSEELYETGQKSFLHNGRYPCYGLYPLKEKNGFLAVAALEEKYWDRLMEILELKLEAKDRFETSEDKGIFGLISRKTKGLTINEAKKAFDSSDCCVDVIEL